MSRKVVFINEVNIKNKKVLLRCDFDVSLNPNATIADDTRIRQNLPTLKYLLQNNNKLVCVAKLDRPRGRDPKLSLRTVVNRLQEHLPNYRITLIGDFLTEDKKTFDDQQSSEVFVLENIRFYPEEKRNDPEFAKKLAALADVYVNDGFAVCHRSEASVVGVTNYLPSYGGLLLKKEIEMIFKVINIPQRPLAAILGGAKISTKINLIEKLIKIADYLLIGGALANVFISAQGFETGSSFCESQQIEEAKGILILAQQRKVKLIIPTDVVVGRFKDQAQAGEVKKINEIVKQSVILDIGPETQKQFSSIIALAKTIIWNGPVGYFENSRFRTGTDFICDTIIKNNLATSLVGGGDTLTAIAHHKNLDKITHISTGGGAMLELIEKGTLPGIEALKR